MSDRNPFTLEFTLLRQEQVEPLLTSIRKLIEDGEEGDLHSNQAFHNALCRGFEIEPKAINAEGLSSVYYPDSIIINNLQVELNCIIRWGYPLDVDLSELFDRLEDFVTDDAWHAYWEESISLSF
jgi:hypothetical protein